MMDVRTGLGRIAVLAAVALIAGCSVVPLPKTMALRGQEPREQDWDVKDCQAEAGYQAGYSPTDSPLANWFQKLFFWGAAGAATGIGVMAVAAGAGATVSGPTFISSPAGQAVVAGAGAGALTGTVLSWSGQKRFEQAWATCMESHGYAVAGPGEHVQAPSMPEP
jgi:hypothetical protein